MRMKGKKVIFSERDTFSLDCVLSPVIAEGLKKFKEVFKNCEHCGYPAIFELSQTSKDSLGDDTDYHDKVSQDLWLTVVDEMIYAFDAEEPEIPDGLLSSESFPYGESGLSELKITVNDEEAYAAYNAECANHEAKCTHGREQFAKYYTYLWW